MTMYKVTVLVHASARIHAYVRAYMRTYLPCVHTRMWAAYYSPPLHLLGCKSARNSSGVILKINLGILSCLPSPAEKIRPV